jgi:LysR family carnitine catabolism transcriptional activator
MSESNPRTEPSDRRRPRFQFKLEELETFLTVAELGSFSRAAEMLGLSQPSVTSRVQRLEALLGISLISRTTRRIILTDAGERLQTTGNATLRDLRILLETFRKETEVRKRRVTIAAPPMLSAVVLLPIITRYVQSHRQTEVKLHDLPAAPALAELADGTADMAIMVLDGHHPEFKFESLTHEECAVVTPLRHPLLQKKEVLFEDIVKYPLLIPDFYRALREVFAAEFTKRGLRFEPLAQMNDVSNISTVIGMVAAGMGITFVPRTLISRDQRGTVGMVPIKGFRLVRHYGIVTKREKPMSAAARSFARFVRGTIREGAGWSD